MTDIYDEMYHLRNQRDAARRVIAKAEAEADRLREAIREHREQTESIAEAVELGHHSPADEDLLAALTAEDREDPR